MKQLNVGARIIFIFFLYQVSWAARLRFPLNTSPPLTWSTCGNNLNIFIFPFRPAVVASTTFWISSRLCLLYLICLDFCCLLSTSLLKVHNYHACTRQSGKEDLKTGYHGDIVKGKQLSGLVRYLNLISWDRHVPSLCSELNNFPEAPFPDNRVSRSSYPNYSCHTHS